MLDPVFNKRDPWSGWCIQDPDSRDPSAWIQDPNFDSKTRDKLSGKSFSETCPECVESLEHIPNIRNNVSLQRRRANRLFEPFLASFGVRSSLDVKLRWLWLVRIA